MLSPETATARAEACAATRASVRARAPRVWLAWPRSCCVSPGSAHSPALSPAAATLLPPRSYSRGRRRAGAGPAGVSQQPRGGRSCPPGTALATRPPRNRSDGELPEPGLQPQIFTRHFARAP